MPINNDVHLVSPTEARVGLCISGMEWNSGTSRAAGMNFNQGGNLNTVSESMFQYYASIGIKLIRVAFIWEALQPVLYDGFMTACSPVYVDAPGAFHKETAQILQNYLDWCDKYGMKVILDLHNYGTYQDFNYVGPQGAVTGIYNPSQNWTGSGFTFYNWNPSNGATVFTGGSQLVTINSGTLPVGQVVRFALGSGGVLPPEVTAGQNYYVVADLSTTTGAISATPGGAPITFSVGSSGTINRSQPEGTTSKKFSDGSLTQAHMNDVWNRIVQKWGTHPAIDGWGLMNEVMISGSISESTWINIVNATIAVIRAAGSNHRVYIDGPYANEATSPYNSGMFGNVIDVADNWQREVHNYLDANRSGAYFDWDYDKIRGFCVDVAGQTGNVYRVGAARGYSFAKAAKISGRPVYNGELGIPMTNDAYYEIAREYVRGVRQALGDITLWGGAQSIYFPQAMAIQSTVKDGKILPHPTFSALLNDADIEDAKLVVYNNPNNRTLIIEAFGSLTESVTVGVSALGVTFDKTEVTLIPGVLRSATITYTPPASTTSSVVFSFTSSRQAEIPAPNDLELLNYDSDNSGSAAQGKLALQNTRSALYIAGSGSDFHELAKRDYESIVPNYYGWGDDRFGIRNLMVNPNGRIRLIQGVGGRLGWIADKPYNLGDYQQEILVESFQNATAGANSNQGTNPPHKANYYTGNSNWHKSITFSRDNTTRVSPILSLTNREQLIGVMVQLNGTTLRLGLENNAAWVYTASATPTVLTPNTVYTATVTCVNGVVNLYLNGVLEATATFTIGAALPSTGGAQGSSTLNLSSTAGAQVYAPISGVGVPPGTLIASVNNNVSVTLCNAAMQPVTLTAAASGNYRVGVPMNSLGVLGNLVNFYPVNSSDNATVYAVSHGNGTLSATDIAGINAFMGSFSEAVTGVPVKVTAPVITGAPIVGGTLTVSNGTWTNNPTSYTYQWLRAGEVIPGATASTYVVTTADIKRNICCLVTAVNASGNSRSALPPTIGAIFSNDAVGYNFNADTLGNAPSDITSQSSALAVVNTGPVNSAIRGWAGQYMRDTQSTNQTGFNAHNLEKFRPTAGHSVTWKASNNGAGVLLMPQAGTTVASFPGLLQGYLFVPSSSAGIKIYVVTAAGLTQLGTTQYAQTLGVNMGPNIYWKASISRGVLTLSASSDGVSFGIIMTRFDTTYTTANGPIQLAIGSNNTPNQVYVSGLALESLT